MKCSEEKSVVSTLFGLTARCRFSIHLSLSEADRQAKHFVPELVVTCRQILHIWLQLTILFTFNSFFFPEQSVCPIQKVMLTNCLFCP